MRLFIGIRPDGNTRARISQQVDRLRPFTPGRYGSPENYHLTLAFLGQRDPESFGKLRQTLEDIAGAFAPFDLLLTGFSAFGRENSAIVYADCAASPPLLELSTQLRGQLTAVGESFDPKPLVPHVTLIRMATLPPDALTRWPEPVPLRVAQLTLFHSTRVDDRLVYLPIWETPLPIHSNGG